MMEGFVDILNRIPLGLWAFISAVFAAVIFLWLWLDLKKRSERRENRAERMARLKQEAIAKLRDERGDD